MKINCTYIFTNIHKQTRQQLISNINKITLLFFGEDTLFRLVQKLGLDDFLFACETGVFLLYKFCVLADGTK